MNIDTEPLAIGTIARFHHLGTQTLEKQYKEHLSDFREWEQKVVPDALVYSNNFWSYMSIDEVAVSQGEIYTIITNKERNGKKWTLAAIVKGTRNEIVTHALEWVLFATRLWVKEITADLANSMDWICRTNFIQATITADRFHVQQIISEAVQELRIEERRKAIDEENERLLRLKENKSDNKLPYQPPTYKNGDTQKQLLARSRYVLFRPENKWTTSQKERAEILFEHFPLIKHAHHLAMNFRGIFEKKHTKSEAKKAFQIWYVKVQNAGIIQLISAANTIKTNEGKILNYFESRSTNAWAESFNAKIKWFRSLVRWVRDTKFFLYRLEKLYA